jgi:uncharacterized protein
MPYVPSKPITHPSPRSPLVFDTRTLGRQPGSARSETRIVPAPADLQVALASVPAGADVKLTVLLEAVSEGVLVTAEAAGPVTGECARCLEAVASSVDVAFRELYEPDDARYAEVGDDSDRRFLSGELLDLEPAFRDAVVLGLPLAPLCRADCAGLCAECGVRLADAGPGHDHDSAPDPRWARLRQLDTGRERQNGASAGEGQEG